LRRIKYDTGISRMSWAARWYGDIARVDPHGDAQLVQAQALLKRWNWDFDGQHSGQALAAILLRTGQKWHYPRRPELDPRDSLAKAAGYLQRHFGTLDPPLGTVLRLRHGAVDLP
ncbi:acylase, partial [Pseudomonas sp. GW531-E2]